MDKEKREFASTYERLIHEDIEFENDLKKRYRELYGVDHTDKHNYDLIIDTNKNNLKEVVDIIVSEYKNWIKN